MWSSHCRRKAAAVSRADHPQVLGRKMSDHPSPRHPPNLAIPRLLHPGRRATQQLGDRQLIPRELPCWVNASDRRDGPKLAEFRCKAGAQHMIFQKTKTSCPFGFARRRRHGRPPGQSTWRWKLCENARVERGLDDSLFESSTPSART
jgi:hypothetical protein